MGAKALEVLTTNLQCQYKMFSTQSKGASFRQPKNVFGEFPPKSGPFGVKGILHASRLGIMAVLPDTPALHSLPC